MITVSLRRGPYGVPVADVSAPHEFLGEFLTAEGTSLDGWACDDLLSAARRIGAGEGPELHGTGDAHTVRISASGVRIQSEYREPPAQCELSLDDFVTAVEQWKALLEKQSRRRP